VSDFTFTVGQFKSFLERTTPKCLRCKVVLFAAEVRNEVKFCPECFDLVHKGGIR
jgi:acetyl-CoA carboxylase beta subunit